MTDRVALLEIEDYEQRCRVERVYLKAVNPKHNSVRGI